jgi:hypothetical protein
LAASEPAPARDPAPEPETCAAGLLLTFIVTELPLTVIDPLALSPNVDVAWLSTCWPLAFRVADVPILSALLWRMKFAADLISISPSHSILTILLTESMTILFFFVLSTIVIFSAPSLSSKMIR